jgi:hypothetical protein
MYLYLYFYIHFDYTGLYGDDYSFFDDLKRKNYNSRTTITTLYVSFSTILV